MLLELSTGMTVTSYLQTRTWDKIEMEFDGSWSPDSLASDFEKMETGVNARAVDFAKFGVLFLNGGSWQGEQVISEDWAVESTSPLLPDNYLEYYSEYFASLPGRGYYRYMGWGMAREGDAYDFFAAGDKGQYIYVSPHKDLVIVRNGLDFGVPTLEWFKIFYEIASRY